MVGDAVHFVFVVILKEMSARLEVRDTTTVVKFLWMSIPLLRDDNDEDDEDDIFRDVPLRMAGVGGFIWVRGT